MGKTGINIKVDKEFYNFLTKRKMENKSNYRIESRRMYKEYTEIKKKLGGGRVFVIK